jgi:trans-aconitate 2-methyltransferase
MTYEFNGRQYERASALQQAWGATILAELGLRGTERVLDLGCGDGTLIARLAELVPQGEVVGIDASEGMLALARQKAALNLHFLLHDINALDWSEEFDVIFSSATIHWIVDHERLLRNISRSLRPGGLARLSFAGEGNCAQLIAVVREAVSSTAFCKYFQGFRWPWFMPAVADYQALAERSGFGEVQVWGENADHWFANAESMIQWIDQPSLVPFLARVADQDKAAFRQFVITRMLERTQAADGRCFETFRRIHVRARK